MQSNKAITALEFKRIIYELWEHSRDTRIRLRVVGQMWMKNYARIVHVTATNGILIQEKDQMKYISLNDVIEFEVESPFQYLQPNNHYEVKLF